MVKALVVMMTTVVATPVLADQSARAASTPRFGVLRPSPANPYRQLFTPQLPKTIPSPLTSPRKPDAKPNVVCGMTVVPADPSIDPKMGVTPQRDANLSYTIRAIAPPQCPPSR